MKLLIAFLILTVSWGAGAQESRMKIKAEDPVSLLALYPLTYEMRYERGNSQDLESRQPVNFGLGYHRSRYSVLFEYSHFSDESGNGTSSVERKHQDLLMWGRYNLVAGTDEHMRGIVYLGAGVGGYEEEVITTFMGSSRSDKTGMKVMGGAAAGLELFMTGHYGGVSAALEGRALMGPDFDPNPVFGVALRLGLVLPL
ncbi:hypothetical protein EZJ49_14705 [Bdellovibrio bacteriovorus]|uniref:hypothetical protein n=1 Tax=Bdellovibrio bacteriovorus TaxID=959 RepID=UPI0021D0A83D|nr:hypothetical protein [Bdellovibrio bacteriovorus]UXR64316.1 hypothetical protein EZJ49_14705 [Bdellovibrio bacteriovorus]